MSAFLFGRRLRSSFFPSFRSRIAKVVVANVTFAASAASIQRDASVRVFQEAAHIKRGFGGRQIAHTPYLHATEVGGGMRAQIRRQICDYGVN